MDLVALLPLIFFISLLLSILIGFPVAFTLGGISIVFALLFTGIDVFGLLPHRLFGTMHNFLFIAIPMFVFMGLMLERSGIAKEMLQIMGKFLRYLRGGLGISIIIVGALLGATTGIVGATVTTMGILSLPILLRYGYSKPMATGIIVSSGTLGQIIPPSIVLILLGSTMQLSVGDLFAAAIGPSLVLIVFYFLYTLIYCNFISKPKIDPNDDALFPDLTLKKIMISFTFPVILILVVLGSIYFGLASPTEASGLGAFCSIIFCWIKGKLSWKMLKEVCRNTSYITCMVFTIFFAASIFGLIFRELEGDRYLVELLESLNINATQFLILVMVFIFIMGCFIDFVEIIFIFVPILLPVMQAYDVDLIWISILIALNLQASFITPPFGFSLFYLKGVAPPSIKTKEIYKGAVPFIILQMITLAIVFIFPEICQLFIIKN